jgi:dTDP-4-dehydrorhamnose reductase
MSDGNIRVVVTGRTGQVAQALTEVGRDHSAEVVCLGRPALDLAAHELILPALRASSPDIIINAGAYTAVDKAEAEPAAAHAVNAIGAGTAAAAASQLRIPIIHLSTDYVFDGRLGRPYVEDDKPCPLNAYGRSKLDGEQLIASAHSDHAILRTAWVYSSAGRNFLKSMLSLARTRDVIRVVADQRGCPTSAVDIAHGVLVVARNLLARPQEGLYRGLFHMVAAGEATWAEFAEAIFATSKAAGGPHARVEPIATSDYPTPAVRAADTRLDSTKIEKVHHVSLPDWRFSVTPVVHRCLSGMHREEEPS